MLCWLFFFCFFFSLSHLVFKFFFKDFIYLFLEREEGTEKERERNISVWVPPACPPQGTLAVTQACALTGNRTGDPLVRRLAFSALSHITQGSKNVFLIVSLVVF